jgi:cysteine desulfurase
VRFPGRNGAEVLAGLGDVAASTGSACHSGSVVLSAVLQAMGIDPEEGRGVVRWSLGRGNTDEEIDTVVARLSALLV